MTYLLTLTITLTGVVPAMVAALRFPKISSEFDLFIASIWLYGFNAGIGTMVEPFGFNNIFHYNIWFLADAYILLWVFKKWNLFQSRKIFNSIAVLLGICWLTETIFFSKLTGDYNSYFRVIYCFAVILMSIGMINIVLLKARGNPLKSSVFLICCTFILLDTITVIGEAFFAYNLVLGNQFRIYMDDLIILINALCSLMFALIILWMPKRQAFTLQY